ncbi:MAG: phosphate butyryltransferase [Treponema sp.]|jgi:phosphate butyryltransferase|nr:phosphate butyryltransferase [Treponema sp.]
MKTIAEIQESLSSGNVRKIAVAAAGDADVLRSIRTAFDEGIAEAILTGNKDQIKKAAEESGIDISPFTLVESADESGAARTAAKLVSEGKAEMIMKGLLPTGIFLKALLDPSFTLRKEGNIISAIAVLEAPDQGRLLFLTDPGFVPLPDFETKRKLIHNVAEVVKKFGIDEPKVAVLCAAETVNPKIPVTVEAAELERLNKNGSIKGCLIAGPISLDLAISESSAKHKNYIHPVAGKADVLLAPDLQSANILYKSLTYFGKLKTGGIMTGANVPVIFTSRSDTAETKLNTILFAAYLAAQAGDGK